MIPLPDDITGADMSQWLNGGCFYAKIGEETRVVAYESIRDEADRSVYVMPLDGTDGPLVVRPKNIFVHWPLCGALNVKDVGIFLVRQQARQYRRTYNARQLRIHIPRKWEAMKLFGADVRDLTANSREVTLAAFKPEYPEVNTAIDRLQSGDIFSCAINPHIVLVASSGALLVYYKGVYAANMGEDGKLLPVNADADTLRRLLKFFQGRALL